MLQYAPCRFPYVCTAKYPRGFFAVIGGRVGSTATEKPTSQAPFFIIRLDVMMVFGEDCGV